jgi:hypothetical protein
MLPHSGLMRLKCGAALPIEDAPHEDAVIIPRPDALP